MFMKRIHVQWYIVCFAVVMGFTAGAATSLDAGYIDSSIAAMGEVQGGILLSLALLSMLWNTALYSLCRIFTDKTGRILSVLMLWFKTMLMGFFCRGLWANVSGIKLMLMLLTVLGGGCICAGMTMEGEDAKARGRRLAVWLCGITVEGIIIPSAARTYALIFN